VTEGVYLLDTSAWIPIKRAPFEPTSERILNLIGAGSIVVNQVVRLELLVGCLDRQDFAATRRDLLGLTELPISQSTWDMAAELGFRLRRAGHSIPVPDLLIAATAIQHDVIVIHDDKHFTGLAANSDLRVESYAESAA